MRFQARDTFLIGTSFAPPVCGKTQPGLFSKNTSDNLAKPSWDRRGRPSTMGPHAGYWTGVRQGSFWYQQSSDVGCGLLHSLLLWIDFLLSSLIPRFLLHNIFTKREESCLGIREWSLCGGRAENGQSLTPRKCTVYSEYTTLMFFKLYLLCSWKQWSGSWPAFFILQRIGNIVIPCNKCHLFCKPVLTKDMCVCLQSVG